MISRWRFGHHWRHRLSSPDPSDSDCEDNAVRLSFELPTVILAAHDWAKLDLPMLLHECRRHGSKWEQSFEDWLFVDTLSIVQSLVADLGGCAQLQCLVPPRIQHPLPMSRRRRECAAVHKERQAQGATNARPEICTVRVKQGDLWRRAGWLTNTKSFSQGFKLSRIHGST